jgi:hypothetical protein
MNTTTAAATANGKSVSIGSMIAFPAMVTLAVTVVRLIGELKGWNPAYFSKEAGGGGALVGISWLIPVFGVVFAMQLANAGEWPASRGRAILFPLLAMALLAGSFFAIVKFVPASEPRKFVGVSAIVSVVCILVAWRGWPKLALVSFCYGIAARVAVAAVMYLSITKNWDTHYSKGAPGMPEMAPFEKWVTIGLVPQMFMWIAITICLGGIFGGLALLVRKKSA